MDKWILVYVACCYLRYTRDLLGDFEQVMCAFIFICMIYVELKIILFYPYFCPTLLEDVCGCVKYLMERNSCSLWEL